MRLLEALLAVVVDIRHEFDHIAVKVDAAIDAILLAQHIYLVHALPELYRLTAELRLRYLAKHLPMLLALKVHYQTQMRNLRHIIAHTQQLIQL